MEENLGHVRPAMLMLNEIAPDFEGTTTKGKIKLSDFKGKWIILFFYTADFAPVETTELIALAKIYDELVKRNVVLLGLSTDHLLSHIAFVRSIKESFGLEIPFPLVADPTMKISTLYGVIHPVYSPEHPVKATFIIDPEMKLRTIMYYQFMMGRNTDEILRVIDALQTHEKYLVALPANWRPGDPVLITPPRTLEVAEKNLQSYECKAWFVCEKKLQ